MTRLLHTLYCDIRLQFRNGFYYAALFTTVILVALFSQSSKETLSMILPAAVLGNMIISTFYFIAGLILLEKMEGTLEAQVTTPLRTWEYLASKVITLTALSLIETLAIISFSFGLGFTWLPMIFGVILLAPLFTLTGFIAVARYDSINEYLFPAALYSIVLSIPLLTYFGLWNSWLAYLHPIQAPLFLLQAAFQPLDPWQIGYGIGYALLWMGLIFILSQKTFHWFVVSRGGKK